MHEFVKVNSVQILVVEEDEQLRYLVFIQVVCLRITLLELTVGDVHIRAEQMLPGLEALHSVVRELDVKREIV